MSEGLLIALVGGGFLLVFPLFWMGIVSFIGVFGWRPLATAYPAEDWPEDGYTVRFQSARIGASSYSGALTAVATDDGLYLRPMVLFRPGHPAVFVPWEAIQPTGARMMGTRFDLRDGPSLVLYGRLASAVSAAAEAADPADASGGA